MKELLEELEGLFVAIDELTEAVKEVSSNIENYTMYSDIEYLRDQFAMAALVGMIVNPDANRGTLHTDAELAYQYANNMLRERYRQPNLTTRRVEETD